MSAKTVGGQSFLYRILFSYLRRQGFILCVGPDEPDATPGEDADEADDDATLADAADEADDDEGEPGEDETLAVAIGAEPSSGSDAQDDLIDGQPAPQWVKDLRDKAKADARKIRELEAKAAQAPAATSEPAAIVVGEKPTLEACDFDSDKYESALLGWSERKSQAEQKAKEAKAQADAAAADWQGKVNAYKEAGAKLKVPDFQDAQDNATAVLSVVQQAIIVNGAGQPALLMYAIGKDPAKLKELAAIKDPVKFAFAAAGIEKEIKVSTRKRQIPAPETRVTGGSSGTTQAVDGTLNRLRAEAERTGDYTKVIKYRTDKKRAKA